MQLVYRVGVVPLLFNTGKSTIRGGELEFTYVPNTSFILEGSLGVLDDEIKSVDEIPLATATLGPENDLPFTPDLSANIGAAYSFDISRFLLTPRLDVSYTSEQFFDAANTREVGQMDSVTVTNFSLKASNYADSWSVTAGIDNVTDEVYPIAGNSSLQTGAGYAEVIYSRPRSYYLSVKYNF
jgi:iron complex outermembrane receptor protein